MKSDLLTPPREILCKPISSERRSSKIDARNQSNAKQPRRHSTGTRKRSLSPLLSRDDKNNGQVAIAGHSTSYRPDFTLSDISNKSSKYNFETTQQKNYNLSTDVTVPNSPHCSEIEGKRRPLSAGTDISSVFDEEVIAVSGKSSGENITGTFKRGESILEGSVTALEGEEFARNSKAVAYLQCSSLTNEGVNDVIHSLLRCVQTSRKDSHVCIVQ